MCNLWDVFDCQIELENKRDLSLTESVMETALTSVAHWLGIVRKAKGHMCDSQSGHMPGIPARSPVWALTRGNQLTFLSHINVSLPFFLPPNPSL